MRTLSPTRKDCLGSLETGMLSMSLKISSSSLVVTSGGDICIVRCLLLLYDRNLREIERTDPPDQFATDHLFRGLEREKSSFLCK